MKSKIIVLLAVVAMFAAAACGPKKSTESTQEAVKSDSTIVKADSTVSTTPKDSVKSK